jgi:Flp pilus assembly protein TadG
MRVTRGRSGVRGAVMVELAVAMPVLLLIVWGAIDFARAYYTANSLASAVREGARYAAVFETPSANTAAIKTKVKTSFQAFGGDTIADSLIVVIDSSNLPLVSPAGYVAVSVRNYPWLSTTPLKIFTGGKILMTRRAVFRWEREPNT